MSMFTDEIAAYQAMIDAFLDERLPAENVRPEVLAKAMRYSVFSGGKRFRPTLCLAAAQVVGGDAKTALLPAGAIELLHTYSLIHDDLPALDDDKERRGKPTSHVVFGEANAILAGDGLLTLAFEWLAQAFPVAPYTAGQLCVELAQAAGPAGMVAGQVEDVLAEGQPVTEEEVLFIDRLKTVALIRASVRIGAMTGGASSEQLQALTMYAEHLGMAYQIVDDIEDYSDAEGSSDVRLQKMTAVSAWGLGAARQKAVDEVTAAVAALDSISGNSKAKDILTQIALLKKLV